MRHPNLIEEKKLWKQGYNFVIGLDEAGRGPLAGPVVAAAVSITPTISTIMATKKHSNIRRNVGMFFTPNTSAKHTDKLKFVSMFSGIKDSKKLSEKQREYFYEKLIGRPEIKWGIAVVSEKVIDKINILEATKMAMRKSVANLQKVRQKKIKEILLIDGNFGLNNVKIPQKSIIKGDEKVFSITAAGIIAKVSRDRIMKKAHKKYPQYGFDRHKGYGTNLHFENLRKFGICEIHRKSFYPVICS